MVVIGLVSFSAKDLIKAIFPITYNQYGFVTAYLGMLIFSPFVNKMIRNINKEQYNILILFGFILFIFIPTFVIGGGVIYLNDVMYFVYIYYCRIFKEM